MMIDIEKIVQEAAKAVHENYHRGRDDVDCCLGNRFVVKSLAGVLFQRLKPEEDES